MVAFTGKSTIRDAWSTFVRPEDTVGLKINTLGLMSILDTPLVSHYVAMNAALVNGLKAAGVPESKMIVWDRTDEELVNAGLSVHKEAGALRVMGTDEKRSVSGTGYGKKAYPVGRISSRVSRILTEQCTACINIPLLKDARGAGVSASLKNHYGTIDNPRDMHESHCTNPGIPEVNTIPVIREKQRLIICDALMGLYDGGPWWQAANAWPYGGLVVGTDPVAVDTVLLGILDEKRISEKLEPIGERAVHVALAAKLGLGTDDIANIEIIRKDLG
jgi:uncharacterized protein (DUF362 family)